IMSHTPLQPSSLVPGISPTLEDLILQMLQKDARLRPHAADASRRLQQVQHAEGPVIRVQPASGLRRVTVGRETERKKLHEILGGVTSGRGMLVTVSGEPGLGKTVLIEGFLNELNAGPRCRIGRGRCSERLAGTEAYLPWLEALEDLLRNDKQRIVADAMKHL